MSVQDSNEEGKDGQSQEEVVLGHEGIGEEIEGLDDEVEEFLEDDVGGYEDESPEDYSEEWQE